MRNSVQQRRSDKTPRLRGAAKALLLALGVPALLVAQPASTPATSRTSASASAPTTSRTSALTSAPASMPTSAPVPDAVIELWEQRWTLNADGSTVYREKKHIRLNNERAYGEFADPRMTYHVEQDKLDILVARVRRPDGSVREVPPYAHVTVSPNATAGWPAFAGIRQHLLVMSGIEPGCVVELEYKITSQPGTKPYLAADLRLDHRYPVVQRTIEVAVPDGVKLSYLLDNLSAEKTAPPAEHSPYRWTFRDLPANPDEPQAPPWPTRCPRLAFSTAGPPEQWLQAILERITAAADQSEAIEKLAREWTKGKQGDAEIVRALQDKLAATFNFVEFDVAWRPAQLRPASEVVTCNYGLPEEAAALFLALVHAMGIEAQPGVLVAEDGWLAGAPQDGMVAAYVVGLFPRVDANGQYDLSVGADLWEARRGRIVREGQWAGYRIFPPVAAAGAARDYSSLRRWSYAAESRLGIAGKVTLAEDGNFVGSVSLRTSGLFAASEKLRTGEAQKTRIGALVGRLLPDVNVESYAVTALAEGQFDVEAKVKSSKALKKVGGRYFLALAVDGPFLADVALPLAAGERLLPVRLPGPFDEQIELTIEWPEKWSVEAQPSAGAPGPRVFGPWGLVEQATTPDEHGLTVTRHTAVNQAELSAADFFALRRPVNELRTERARTLILKP